MYNSSISAHKNDSVLLQEMGVFLHDLKKQSGPLAYAEAKAALQRTGVTTKTGKTKKKIVTWE